MDAVPDLDDVTLPFRHVFYCPAVLRFSTLFGLTVVEFALRGSRRWLLDPGAQVYPYCVSRLIALLQVFRPSYAANNSPLSWWEEGAEKILRGFDLQAI